MGFVGEINQWRSRDGRQLFLFTSLKTTSTYSHWKHVAFIWAIQRQGEQLEGLAWSTNGGGTARFITPKNQDETADPWLIIRRGLSPPEVRGCTIKHSSGLEMCTCVVERVCGAGDTISEVCQSKRPPKDLPCLTVFACGTAELHVSLGACGLAASASLLQQNQLPPPWFSPAHTHLYVGPCWGGFTRTTQLQQSLREKGNYSQETKGRSCRTHAADPYRQQDAPL